MPADMVRAVPLIRRDPLRFLRQQVARHGDLLAFPMPRGRALLVNDPVGVRRVLLDRHRAYGKDTVQYTSLAEITGSGLLTADGDTWRLHRRIVRPAFRHAAFGGVAGHATSVAMGLRARWDAAPGQVLDADEAVMSAMLDLVGRTLFSADLVEPGPRIAAAVDEGLRLVVRRAPSPLPRTWPTPGRRRLLRAVATLDAETARLVRARRARGVEADDDLLGLLLRAADTGEITPVEVRDEIITMIIAGHETVASALIWTLHLLASHPGVQDELAAELDGTLGGRAPGWDDLPGLRYTRAVVDESLRLFPPAWVISRRAVEDDVIGGVAVPAGTLVIMSPWLLHRRPGSWPDPQRFDPGRFLHGERSAPRGDYLPFGLGPRLCIGRDLALVEAVLVLATLLAGRRVTAATPGAAPRVSALVTLRPEGGLPLRLTRRRLTRRRRGPGP